VDGLANISPQQAGVIKNEGGRVEQTPLPRIFAVFFNQNQAPIFANKEVRQALDVAVDKDLIVKDVLNGEGISISSPIPPGLLQNNTDTSATPSSFANGEERIVAAKKILEDSKWKFNTETNVYEKKVGKATTPLTFSISTSNAPELKAAAEILKVMWEKVGAIVEIKIFEIGELNQNVIRTRKYDALLFGEIVGRDLDLFAFWHSSQRNDPGLNIALYANTKADKLLETARADISPETKTNQYLSLEKEIQNDISITHSHCFEQVL